MSKRHEPDREYTGAEQQQSFLKRRYQAFADRSRDPGDVLTWAVVLGALICSLLIVCVAVADLRNLVLPTLFAIVLWVIVVSRFGRVNVAAILWGASTADSERVPNPAFVYFPTLALAIVCLVAVVIDAGTGWGFGWFGLALGIASFCYCVMFARSWSHR
ncbi:MAG: hypothetical protein M9953_05225 [Thermomicrobiales bacterium]|nr:hypothetical protein [Thermomicrobiales bacterium]